MRRPFFRRPMPRFRPQKGFDTRKNLQDPEHVRLLCHLLRLKIEMDWLTKWEPHHLGFSLSECFRQRKFSSFIKLLKEDILSVFQQSTSEKADSYLLSLSESSLKRFLKDDTPAKFLQEHTKEMLAIYVGYASWEEFKKMNTQKQTPPSEVCAAEKSDTSAVEKTVEKEGEEAVPYLPVYNDNQELVIVTTEEYLPLLIEINLLVAFFDSMEPEEPEEEEILVEEVKQHWWSKKHWGVISNIFLIAVILFFISKDLFFEQKFVKAVGVPTIDILGKDEAAIYYTVQLTGEAELAVYRSLPNLDTSMLDDCYTADSPSRKRIIKAAKRRKEEGLTMGLPQCESKFEILDYQLVYKTDSFAVIRTLERWHLDFWDMKNQKKHTYNYDNEDWQYHYLSKQKNGRWLVDSLLRTKDGKTFVLDK